MRWLRVCWFNLRQFCAVSHFAQTMVLVTTTTTLVQWLGIRVWGGNATVACMRAAMIGMWTTSVFSAGLLGFERHKGTLVHLVSDSRHTLATLALVVLSAATFGLVSFPAAWIAWALLSHIVVPLPNVGLVLLFWLACSSVSLVIASLFVLTPNAIAYEGLLLAPVMLVSGLLWPLADMPARMADVLRLAIPLAAPVEALLSTATEVPIPLSVLLGLISSLSWIVLAWVLGRLTLRRALVSGTLEVV